MQLSQFTDVVKQIRDSKTPEWLEEVKSYAQSELKRHGATKDQGNMIEREIRARMNIIRKDKEQCRI